jgi:glutamate-5-semialdehyde dehydrogenase
MNMVELGKNARRASRALGLASDERKKASLLCLAERLLEASADILTENERDLEEARRAGLSAALLDRLALNEARMEGIAADLRAVAILPDPVGEVFDEVLLPNGLRTHKRRVPLGVLGVIYEARPNVTVDVTGLAIKTGNAAILRGGSETINSNRALIAVIQRALREKGLPAEAIQMVDDTDRKWVYELLQMYECIDMIIPRGGAALHDFCRENSRIPVITGGIGICHLFVDETADMDASLKVIRNAKIQRPTVCNALDTVLIHRNVATQFLPKLVDLLVQDGVTFRADETALHYLEPLANPAISPASPDDFDTEWLSLVLGLRVVGSLDEAIRHIQAHSTGHSDGILTKNESKAQRFVAEVDSAVVYVNASTRFTDGAQLGLGAEVAVSTQRMHARGPMGLRELTTYKWVVLGDYHVRS